MNNRKFYATVAIHTSILKEFTQSSDDFKGLTMKNQMLLTKIVNNENSAEQHQNQSAEMISD